MVRNQMEWLKNQNNVRCAGSAARCSGTWAAQIQVMAAKAMGLVLNVYTAMDGLGVGYSETS